MPAQRFRYEDHLVLFSLLAGAAAWILDAAADTLFFGQGTFLDALVLDVSAHEAYFRLFLLASFLLFGWFVRGSLVRRRYAEDELRKALERVEDEKARSEAIIAAIPDGISIQDRTYRVIYQNKVHQDLVGDQTGKVCYEKYASRDAVCPGCPVARSFEDGGRHVLEKQVPAANGSRYIEISSAPLRNASGEIIAGIEAVRDITARKRIELELEQHRERLAELVDARTGELKEAGARLQREVAERQRIESELARVQKLESLGLLAGGVAHDFNNLLGAIMGNLSLAMLDVDMKSPSYHQLVKAERASVRAQELTQQLLTVSRGGAPVKRPVSLPAVIVEAAGFSLRGSRVLHELNLPRDLWPVDADEGQMMQVFSNLLINADQAMPKGGIIRITGANVDVGPNEVPPLGAGRYVKVTVRDEGTGILPEHLSKVFDPYFTTKPKGSGLGLAATYSIIRRHDGFITVESAPGTGATFHLYLPASDGEVAPPALLEKALEGSGRVLIMDDEPDMRETTGAMLERLGYTVDYAGEGVEALEKYRAARDAGDPFDAVIMDLTVHGGMGGQETVRRLLELDPAARAVVSSGYSHDPVMADHRTYGFRDMVVKPYRIRELSEVMARVIRGRA